MDENIRPAALGDIPRIVELGRRFLQEGPYKDELADKPEEATQFAANMLNNSKGTILVAEKDGALIGVIAFITMPHWFSGEITATEMIWYVEPEHRAGGIAMRLMWASESLAKALGATRMAFTAPTPQVGEIYKRFGYKMVEIAYQRSLTECRS